MTVGFLDWAPQEQQPPAHSNGHSNGHTPNEGYAAAALARELDTLAAAREGERNHQLNRSAFNLGQLVASGELAEATVVGELTRVSTSIGLAGKEIERTIQSGIASGGEAPRAVPQKDTNPVRTITGTERSTSSMPGGGVLPEEFWNARPVLDHIRQAAWSRGRSAESVLGTTLARVAADTHHALKLPPTVGASCGLSLIACLSGPPGTGKSSSKGIAAELVPPRLIDTSCDDVPPGSGEGIIELLFDMATEDDPDTGKSTRVKRQTRHNVFTYTDEGELLTNQARRGTVSTILPTLRSVFTDGTLGQANASEDRKRVVPGGKYVYGIIVALQPERAGALFEDAGGGTPQRFLWFATNTPVPPPGERPEWPGALPRPDPKPVVVTSTGWKYLGLPDAVKREIQVNDHHKQQHGCNPLDEHADLLRLKTAAILAILDGRNDINAEDWELARMVRDASNATRDAALSVLSQQREEQAAAQREKRSKEAVAEDEAVATRRTIDVARKIARKVHAEPERWKTRALRHWMGRDRDVFSDALDHAVNEGWVTEETEWVEGARGPGEARFLRPGGGQP